ncbi:alpha/beta hydrolase [Methylobacterium haplocladii]|uniref:Palmitoyl-protein thioesterase ABHD10, mitochondrial n=1 Tax=Methylobacterium haplocladii TaxID=1176176 RepID=A0A512IJ52_9HYPH|nr:alpha/beta hydrolase [Methylobacterium haplocladii]GEO97730.1 alpha/beta hydrolase [Methylobacterium haplocladii]GJD84046.1 2-succinyl-6-hydroxy-2, 4-cyclohexadiene-1-carboxylate synthase [Methylobacterium haplocladii]GLS57460.1 alpha/beta hydrolase [Methylobacterium haplocladii]
MTSEADALHDDLPVQTISVGNDAQRRDIAVRVRSGKGRPIVWLGGFRSDMRATKALALDAWALQHGRPLVRFDYTGHGVSGGRFADAVISNWVEDALAVLERFADDRPVLVGSSMGGWVTCLAVRKRLAEGRASPAGIVLIAPALDFTHDLMWEAFPAEVRTEIERNGVWYRKTDYAPEPDPISLALIEDGRRNRLLTGPLDLRCPVHILQGMNDPDVPYAHALKTVERLPAAGTLLTLIKDGDHRLSRPQDIDLILRSVAAIA